MGRRGDRGRGPRRRLFSTDLIVVNIRHRPPVGRSASNGTAMDNLVLASTQADAKAAELIIGHHAEMDSTLGLKAELVATAARTAGHAPAEEARLGLHRWCRDVLVPHAMAAEATLCRAGGELPDGRLLVEAMVVEHRIIGDLVETIAQSDDAIDTALAASALRHLFTAHLTKVNDQLVPLLVRDRKSVVSGKRGHLR